MSKIAEYIEVINKYRDIVNQAAEITSSDEWNSALSGLRNAAYRGLIDQAPLKSNDFALPTFIYDETVRILQIDAKTKEVVNEFENMKLASQETNTNYNSIYKSVKKHIPDENGYLWEKHITVNCV